MNELRDLYFKFRVCMVRIGVRTDEGDLRNGSGFHIGEGYIVTARHVVENKIVEVVPHRYANSAYLDVSDIYFHSDPKIDLAVLKTNFSLEWYMSDRLQFSGPGKVPEKTNFIPIGFHLDDWTGDEFILSKVLLMGYPAIPLSRDTTLVAVEGEVNAIVDRYDVPHPHFVISSLARGGFSGGPVISEGGYLLGVQTTSLISENQTLETGFFASVTIEPLLVLCDEANIHISYNLATMSDNYWW